MQVNETRSRFHAATHAVPPPYRRQGESLAACRQIRIGSAQTLATGAVHSVWTGVDNYRQAPLKIPVQTAIIARNIIMDTSDARSSAIRGNISASLEQLRLIMFPLCSRSSAFVGSSADLCW